MRDGRLKIEYVAGEVKGASVNAGLDDVYARMFNNAKRNAKKRPDSVESGIQIIVFGAFLLEAVCNDRYRTFLSCTIPDRALADAVWSVTKGLKITEKIGVAVAVGSRSATETNRDEEAQKLTRVTQQVGTLQRQRHGLGRVGRVREQTRKLG